MEGLKNRQMENIFLNDLCLLLEGTEFCNYVCNHELEHVISKLVEIDSEQLSKWFDDNIMKKDAEKCHFTIDFMLLLKKFLLYF